MWHGVEGVPEEQSRRRAGKATKQIVPKILRRWAVVLDGCHAIPDSGFSHSNS